MGSGPAVGFALSVPDSWFEVDVKPATRDDALRALVEQRVREVPQLWEQRAAITRILRQQARRAWDAGAVYCASMIEPTEAGPVTASVTVSLVRGPLDARSDDPDRLAPLVARLTPKDARHDDDTWTEVTTVDIPAVGPCARSHGVEDVELPDDAGWVRVVQMQTFAPVPDASTVVIVSCSSPVLPLAEGLLDMFDAITGTLRLVTATTTGVGS